jgi:hypothetical protein
VVVQPGGFRAGISDNYPCNSHGCYFFHTRLSIEELQWVTAQAPNEWGVAAMNFLACCVVAAQLAGLLFVISVIVGRAPWAGLLRRVAHLTAKLTATRNKGHHTPGAP